MQTVSEIHSKCWYLPAISAKIKGFNHARGFSVLDVKKYDKGSLRFPFSDNLLAVQNLKLDFKKVNISSHTLYFLFASHNSLTYNDRQ